MVHYKNLSNQSVSQEIPWELLYFKLCKDHEMSLYIWCFGITLCFLIGFPASVAILWESLKTRQRQTPLRPNDFFMMNLSVMDLAFLITIPPGILNHFFWRRKVILLIWKGFYGLSTCGRPLLMACMCLDCYVAVVHPVVYHKNKNLTPRIVMVGIVWTLTAAFMLVQGLLLDSSNIEFSNIPFVITIVIIVFCDSFILFTLIRSDRVHPQKQRAIQTLVNSLVLASVSYLPPVFLNFLRDLFDFTTYTCSIYILATLTCTQGSAVMPLLYLNNLGKLDRFKICKRS